MRDTMNRPRLPWCRKELGHHATRATRFALATVWLAAPWRLAARLVLRLCVGLVGRRQPPRLTAAVAVLVVVVAVVQAVQAGDWATAIVLGGAATMGVAVPLADAAVSRRSELAADRYAADVGVGQELARALHAMGAGGDGRRTWSQRLLDRHPPLSRRVDALNAG
jgi:STE24 endopeptidase